MKKYAGTKMIEASPMDRGEYNKYRGWKIPAGENPSDEGYLVKYSDGYESWSPKKQFEDAYRDCMGMNFGIALELMKKGIKNSQGKLVQQWKVCSVPERISAGNTM